MLRADSLICMRNKVLMRSSYLFTPVTSCQGANQPVLARWSGNPSHNTVLLFKPLHQKNGSQMASSFLEDLLEKEVDEKEVSAMVGSLESQLASTAIPRSHHNEVKASVAASKASPKQSNMTSKTPNQTSPIQNQTASAVRTGISSSPVLNAGGNTTITTVVNIAPRPTVTTAVPLVPRPATMAVLAPNSGFAGAPRFVTINADLVNRNLSLINPQQMALAPRVVTGNVTLPGNPQTIATPRIIQQIQPRAANMRPINPTQIVLQQPAGSTPIQPDKKINIIRTPIRPVPASVSVSQNVPIRTSLTPIRPQISTIPGTITYTRMPVNQVAVATSKTEISSAAGTLTKNSNSSNVANVGLHASKPVTNNVTANQSKPPQATTTAPVTHSQPQVNVVQIEQAKEQAHKLKNFFNNLIRLASDQKSPDVGKTVKELVQGVLVSWIWCRSEKRLLDLVFSPGPGWLKVPDVSLGGEGKPTVKKTFEDPCYFKLSG